MGCNISCIDPEYLNQPMEVRIDDRNYVFEKRPRDLRTLFEKLPEIEEMRTSKSCVFEYSSNEGVKQVTSDLILHEAYITHSDKKLIIGSRSRTEDFCNFE